MPSSYSTRLRLEEQANGENGSTWGTKLNTVFDMIDEAIAGYIAIATTGGTTTLTSNNSATDQARMAILKATGVLVLDAIFQIPAVSKVYHVWNATSGNYSLTVKTAGGSGIAVSQGKRVTLFCDGTDCYAANTDAAAMAIAGLSGNTFTGEQITPASTTAVAGLRIPHGAGPTSPINGQFWTTTAGAYIQINGVTTGPLVGGSASQYTQIATNTISATPATVAFNGLASEDIIVDLNGISITAGSADLTLAVSIDNGLNYGTALAISPAVLDTNVKYASISMTGLKVGNIVGSSTRRMSASSGISGGIVDSAANGGNTFTWRVGAAVNAIRIGTSASTFVNGSIINLKGR